MGKNGFSWRLLLYATLVTIVICLVDAFLESDALLYLFLVIPIVSLSLLSWLLAAAIAREPRSCITIVAMLTVYWALSFGFVKNYYTIRNAARWSVWSRRYKADVLAQASSGTEQFKHIDWDGWGFPGAGDTTVYLVFDPTDSLSAAAKSHHPGKFSGLPCTVPLVSRLERQWYAVLFYTDERWGRPHWDCGMQD